MTPRAAAVLLCACLPLAAGTKKDVLRSSHNLSVTGSPVSSTEQDACHFCHTPHNSDVNTKPLWNHQLSLQPYTVYTSSTYNGGPGTPGAGSSKLCLSCHDGTIALGQTVTTTIPTSGSMSAHAVLGTNLANDHPVGFRPVDDGQLAAGLTQNPPVSKDPAVKLPGGRVECTSCHDPHTQNIDAAAGKFLVRSNSGGALCLACHDPNRAQPNALAGWSAGAHATSGSTVPATAQFGPYGAVGSNACSSCHTQHAPTAPAAARLLSAPEEAACSPCHGGANVSPALPDIMSEFSKTYRHPVTTVSGQHDPAEDIAPVSGARHAECADCHNPHGASASPAGVAAPGLQAALAGAGGFNGGGALRPAANEYEVCFKCHADSANKPQTTAGYSVYGRTPVRQTNSQVTDPYNERLRFASPVSRHNVTNPSYRGATNVPSLRPSMLTLNGAAGASLATGTYIYCTDCHNNDQDRKAAGSGPNGPHGSQWAHLLERRYDQEVPGSGGTSYVSGPAGSAALCNKCHDVDRSILQNVSFKRHSLHVQGERASCSTCHDPHGVQGGAAANNYALVNFDTSIVRPNSSGILRFEHTGPFQGRCYLSCHGENHNPESYGP